jgi:hypothetical protein
MSSEEELLKRLYEHFHARDLESALAAVGHIFYVEAGLIKRFDIREG